MVPFRGKRLWVLPSLDSFEKVVQFFAGGYD